MSELLFSITAKDCRWDYFRGSGKGGQKRNKTSSGVRCTHRESGAVGVSDDTRSQHKNKSIAFERMAQTSEFKAWHKVKCAKVLGVDQVCKDYAEKEVRSSRIKEEVFSAGGWHPIEEVENE